MKKGIIIIFDKKDLTILEDLSFKLPFSKQIRICLINNGNHNKVLDLLSKLKETSQCEVFILNLRKEKTLILAVKAGVRFLYNIEDFNLIVHTKPIDISNKSLMKKLVSITDENLVNKKAERVLLRKVYSLEELINCQ